MRDSRIYSMSFYLYERHKPSGYFTCYSEKTHKNIWSKSQYIEDVKSVFCSGKGGVK